MRELRDGEGGFCGAGLWKSLVVGGGRCIYSVC